MSNAFPDSTEMIICFLSFNLLIWCLIFNDVLMLNRSCILGINSTWSCCMRLVISYWIWVAICCWESLHLPWAYNFLFLEYPLLCLASRNSPLLSGLSQESHHVPFVASCSLDLSCSYESSVAVFTSKEVATSSSPYWLTQERNSVSSARDSGAFSTFLCGYICSTLHFPSWGEIS